MEWNMEWNVEWMWNEALTCKQNRYMPSNTTVVIY